MKNLHFILNPASGWGRGQATRRKLVSALSALNLQSTVHETSFRGQAEQLARSISEQNTCDTIVAVGGDGTVHEIANGILRSSVVKRPSLGIIPAGSSNDISKSLSIPENLSQALALAVSGRARRIDTGEISGRFFVMASALGLFADIAQKSLSLKGVSGAPRYLLAGLLAIWDYKAGGEMTVTTDTGRIQGRFGVVMVGNLKRFGGLTLLPEAIDDNGFFEGFTIETMSRTEALKLFYGFAKSSFAGHPKIRHFKTRRLSIESSEEPLINVDGEIHKPESRYLEYRILPGSLEIITPISCRS